MIENLSKPGNFSKLNLSDGKEEDQIREVSLYMYLSETSGTTNNIITVTYCQNVCYKQTEF